jgi:hypothetical protein
MIPLPEADRVAVAHGYYCAEQLVRALAAAPPPTVQTSAPGLAQPTPAVV